MTEAMNTQLSKSRVKPGEFCLVTIFFFAIFAYVASAGRHANSLRVRLNLFDLISISQSQVPFSQSF